jgi:hypothetical protein
MCVYNCTKYIFTFRFEENGENVPQILLETQLLKRRIICTYTYKNNGG